MHDDLKKYEDEIEGCKKAREWLDSYGTDDTHAKRRTVEVYDLGMKMGDSDPGRRDYAPPIVRTAMIQLVEERWPELSFPLRVTIDKREAAARVAMRELARKVLEEVK